MDKPKRPYRRVSSENKEIVRILDLLAHYVAIGIIEGMPLAYEQIELFDRESVYVAENIKRLRKENNMTAFELAKKIHMTQSSITKYETHRVMPNDSILTNLASIFRVDVSELVKEA